MLDHGHCGFASYPLSLCHQQLQSHSSGVQSTGLANAEKSLTTIAEKHHSVSESPKLSVKSCKKG